MYLRVTLSYRYDPNVIRTCAADLSQFSFAVTTGFWAFLGTFLFVCGILLPCIFGAGIMKAVAKISVDMDIVEDFAKSDGIRG